MRQIVSLREDHQQHLKTSVSPTRRPATLGSAAAGEQLMKQQTDKSPKKTESNPQQAKTAPIKTEADRSASSSDMAMTECLTVSVVKAGAILGVARGTAYKAVRSGDIPGIKVRNRWVVPLQALHAMLAARDRDPWA